MKASTRSKSSGFNFFLRQHEDENKMMEVMRNYFFLLWIITNGISH